MHKDLFKAQKSMCSTKDKLEGFGRIVRRNLTFGNTMGGQHFRSGITFSYHENLWPFAIGLMPLSNLFIKRSILEEKQGCQEKFSSANGIFCYFLRNAINYLTLKRRWDQTIKPKLDYYMFDRK